MKTLFKTTRRAALGAMAGAALLAAAPAAFAQTWPSKPVRIVIGAPPGGTADIVARLLADGLQKEWGQPVIVEAKPGAAGMIAMQDFLTQPADGYTLLVSVNALVTEIPHVIKVRFDPFKDVKPLADLARSGLVFVANASLPAKNVPELVAYAKANPGKLSYASYSAGTISHTMGLELNKAAGIDLNHVPYKGSPPALQDLAGGHVQLMFDGPATSVPMIKGGKIKPLAVSGPKRNPALPEVPTFAEQGFPVLEEVAWMGLWIKPEVPAELQAKIRQATLKVMTQPLVQTRLTELGNDLGSGASPEDLAKSLRAASDKQGATLRALGVKPQDLGG
ncbi:MAG: tripartite tricarboxylate transporter substrate binding protein [Burkholderiaceae bacterium]|jgi:tripartite-type tricarboxylate transporter receptor subunit TctC|nr:tripartite tricarboxylate transporter substrate binding protein [Burkholderiaceae bacterium]